jgi:hypothetical protein
MKKMQKIGLLFLIYNVTLFSSSYAEKFDKDSIIVTFGDKTRLIIYGDDKQELEQLLKYDLNALLSDLAIRLDTISGDTRLFIDELEGDKYLKVKSEKEGLVIGLRGIRYRKGDLDVKLSSRNSHVRLNASKVNSDSLSVPSTGGRKVYTYSSPRKGFYLDLGLNAYGANQANGYHASDYNLRPLGSRYISLGAVASAPLIRREKAGLHLDLGVDFSWYNLMFEGNNTVIKETEALAFPVLLTPEGSEVKLKKSKLTVPYVNLSLMPTLNFRKAFVSHVSAGVYGGYRLGGYTKTKRDDNGDKERIKGNYFVNDWRYGLTAEIGIRHFVDFFFNYDLNDLYQDGRGPAVRVMSFGIRL